MFNIGRIFFAWDSIKLICVIGIFILSAIVEGFGVTAVLPAVASYFESETAISERSVTFPFSQFGEGILSQETLVSILIVAICVKAILIFFANMFLAVVASYITSSQRLKAFKIVENYTKQSFQLSGPGEILSILNEHIKASSQSFVNFAYAVSYCFIALVYGIFSFAVSSYMFFYLIIFGCVVGVGMRWLNRIAVGISASNVRESISFLDSWARLYRSWYYLKATGLFGRFEDPTNKQVERLRVLEVKLGALTALLTSIREPIFMFLIFVILSLTANDKNDWVLDLGSIFLLFRAYSAAMNAAQRMQKCSQKYGSVTLVHQKVFLANNFFENLIEGALAPDEGGVLHINLRGYRSANLAKSHRCLTTDIDLSTGDILAVSGASGSGKTTFLNLLLGLEPLELGEYYYGGINVAKSFPELLRSQIGFVPQDPCLIEGRLIDNLVSDLKLADDVEFRLKKVYPLLSFLNLTQIGESVGMSIDSFVNQDIGSCQLSGGELQRICIAREVLKEPNLLVLDEPTSALDSKTSSLVIELLNKISPTTIIVFASHDDALLKICTKSLVLD